MRKSHGERENIEDMENCSSVLYRHCGLSCKATNAYLPLVPQDTFHPQRTLPFVD
jgi:hypothetical protein